MERFILHDICVDMGGGGVNTYCEDCCSSVLEGFRCMRVYRPLVGQRCTKEVK